MALLILILYLSRKKVRAKTIDTRALAQPLIALFYQEVEVNGLCSVRETGQDESILDQEIKSKSSIAQVAGAKSPRNRPAKREANWLIEGL